MTSRNRPIYLAQNPELLTEHLEDMHTCITADVCMLWDLTETQKTKHSPFWTVWEKHSIIGLWRAETSQSTRRNQIHENHQWPAR